MGHSNTDNDNGGNAPGSDQWSGLQFNSGSSGTTAPIAGEKRQDDEHREEHYQQRGKAAVNKAVHRQVSPSRRKAPPEQTKLGWATHRSG